MRSTVDDMDSTPPTAPDQEHAPEQPPGDPEAAATTQGPRVTREQVSDLGRLRRTVQDRHIAGVAGGLARHLDVDPIIIRVAFVVATFFGGAGLLLYGACWLLVPEEGTDDQPLGLDERSRTIGLVGVGVLALISAFGDWAGAFWFPWPAVVVAAIVVWAVHRNRAQAELPPPWPRVGPTPAQAPPGQSPHGQTSYAQTVQEEANRQAWAGAGWQPTPARPWDPAATTWQPPVNPRRRGPVLFGFTLALIALAEGALGMADIAGLDVVPSAYPALALGVIAVMLAVGAFWGRAGGLIVIGIVAALATAITTAAENFETEVVRYSPTAAAAVPETYNGHTGDLVVDLSGIVDVGALDGHELRIDSGAGTVEVILPQGMDVTVDGRVGAGSVHILGDQADGLDAGLTREHDAGPDAPTLDITIDLGLGEVVVREP